MEMSENINKVWGERRRIHIDALNEVDLLYLKKDTFCSTHKHKFKKNKFIVVSGRVRIETDFGHIILRKNDTWEISPPLRHRFCAEEDSIMIEIATISPTTWKKTGAINPDDINRESQGGRIIDEKEMTLDEMLEKGLGDL